MKDESSAKEHAETFSKFMRERYDKKAIDLCVGQNLAANFLLLWQVVLMQRRFTLLFFKSLLIVFRTFV